MTCLRAWRISKNPACRFPPLSDSWISISSPFSPISFVGPLSHGMVFQAQKRGLIDIRIHDLRDFTTDRHKTVDDRPFGGGAGMVLKPEPLFRAIRKIRAEKTSSSRQGHSTHTPGQTV